MKKILYIEPRNGPDLAFIQFKDNDSFPEKINLASTVPTTEQDVCTIGYPAKDEKYRDQTFMDELFDGGYTELRESLQEK